MEAKVAIVLQAGTDNDEGLARAFHSMVYAKDLRERGAEVRLIFDGAGTQWPVQFHHPHIEQAKELASLMEELRSQGVAYAICDYCSNAFGVRDDLKAHGEPLVAEYMDHPSIANLVADGYQILIL
ncbi:MAG TPA: DsrE family protein [Dehalococcoidia bacterium]|nr:DsrE family protein [Dehalococcoidia bacterium]